MLNSESWARTAGLGLATAGAAWLVSGLLLSLPPGRAPSALTGVLVIVCIILPVICCFRRDGVRGFGDTDFLQPGAVFAVFVYLYMLVPGLYISSALGYHSNWAHTVFPAEPLVNRVFLLTILALIAFGLSYRASWWPDHDSSTKRRAFNPQLRWTNATTILLILMVLVGAFFKARHWAAVGGIAEHPLQNLSPALRAEADIRISGVVVLMESLFDWGVVLLLFRWFTTSRAKFATLLLAGCAVILTYLLTGKRSTILPYFLFPVVWYHYLRCRFTLGRSFALFGIGLFFMAALLTLRALAFPLVTSGAPATFGLAGDLGAPVTLYLNLPELNAFDMTMTAVHDRDQLLDAVGGTLGGILKYNFETLLHFVPRSLWSEKPVFTDLGQVFYQWTVGGRSDVGFTVGIIGALYLFGHVIGVLAGLLVLGAAFRWLYMALRPWEGNALNVLLYSLALLMAFQLVRFGTLGFTVLFFIQFHLVGLVAILLLAMLSHADHPNHVHASSQSG